MILLHYWRVERGNGEIGAQSLKWALCRRIWRRDSKTHGFFLEVDSHKHREKIGIIFLWVIILACRSNLWPREKQSMAYLFDSPLSFLIHRRELEAFKKIPIPSVAKFKNGNSFVGHQKRSKFREFFGVFRVDILSQFLCWHGYSKEWICVPESHGFDSHS